MNYRKAIAIMKYWNAFQYAGRIKTKEVIEAEAFLANPILYIKKIGNRCNKNQSAIYARKRLVKKQINNSINSH